MEHGTVTSVNYEEGVVYCDVRPNRGTGGEYSDRPVLKSHSGFVQIPKQGERVAMQKLADGTRFISDVLSRKGAYPENPEEGDIALQLDKDTKLVFQKRSDGKYDVNLGASGTLSLSANGEMHLDAPDGVFINGTKFQDHTHAYSWTDLGGSGNTDSPN
jgi:hypothetical protein